MSSSDNNWHDVGRNDRSFLLRCWQEGQLADGKEPDAASVWRFTLVPIDNPSRARGFACLEELCASLSVELAAEEALPM